MFNLQNITIYEDKYFFYVWKYQGIPTTLGKKKSFIEYLKENIFLLKNRNENFYHHLKNFDLSEEFLLLNRLDNDTGGLLYFAKNKEIFKEFKDLQEKGKIEKIYLADVYGNLYKKREFVIDYPIMHHKHLKDRMVVIKKERDLNKGRGKIHKVITKILPLYYDEEKNRTTVYAIIKKGIRHQIRVHLASIGYPIVGDKLYAKKVDFEEGLLHLWSIGLNVKTEVND